MEADLGVKPDTINDLRRQLQQAQSQLDDARKRYTAEHPDRVRLEAMVKSLQADLDAALAAGASRGFAAADTAALSPTDPTIRPMCRSRHSCRPRKTTSSP